MIAGSLGTGRLAIFSLWRCLRGDVVIKILNNKNNSESKLVIRKSYYPSLSQNVRAIANSVRARANG